MANGDVLVALNVTGSNTNGISFNYSNSDTTASSARIQKQLVSVDSASEVNLLQIAATETGQTFSSFDGILIRNLDSTNFVRIGRAIGSGDEIYEKLPAGKFMVINDISIEAITGGTGFSGWSSLDKVTAQADTADVDIEMYVWRT